MRSWVQAVEMAYNEQLWFDPSLDPLHTGGPLLILICSTCVQGPSETTSLPSEGGVRLRVRYPPLTRSHSRQGSGQYLFQLQVEWNGTILVLSLYFLGR